MPTIAFRATHTLNKRIIEAAARHGTSKSDLVRSIIEDNLQINPTEDWEIMAWNIFSISSDQFKYAIRNARTAEEFFSSIGKWAKNLDLKVFRTETHTGISIRYSEQVITISQPRILSKMETISKIIIDLDIAMQKIITDMGKELEKDFKPD